MERSAVDLRWLKFIQELRYCIVLKMSMLEAPQCMNAENWRGISAQAKIGPSTDSSKLKQPEKTRAAWAAWAAPVKFPSTYAVQALIEIKLIYLVTNPGGIHYPDHRDLPYLPHKHHPLSTSYGISFLPALYIWNQSQALLTMSYLKLLAIIWYWGWVGRGCVLWSELLWVKCYGDSHNILLTARSHSISLVRRGGAK
jgi:hypothetical protein